ncbi:peptide chain release factor 2, putative [Plasmodium chabaudi chabaudi]|uniref:Peptide chain release factor 2, putative n=1 Tax=Plasmodium chabaudi chabaudi TaxID=31271 RepID=A0A1C6XDU9_PLACU|nr:peptide chain release factor 2, putative [Plasmodium chabaudi chabaudi]
MFFNFTLFVIYVNIYMHANIAKCFISFSKNNQFTNISLNLRTIKRPIQRRYLKNSLNDKLDIINKKLQDIGICPKNIEETFIKGTGKGGQKVNKTNNCVMIKYDRTNDDKIVIKCHKYRCLQQNRVYARELLYEKITSINNKAKEDIINQIEKEKRQILKLTEAEKNRSINYKKKRSEIKSDRQKHIIYDSDI